MIITTDKKIFLYEVDEFTFMPVLKSVIFNFLGISNLIESISKEVYITYTVGQEDFTVHRRKYHHDFRIPIESMKRSKHCCAIEI